ncbi:MAG TPA: polyphosphate polymerase domain-containing protein [Flavobacteriales bacterium]|nr:polyphosphate polymerase domain-containing protein [Flavobacteriales bacterium]
MKDGLTQILESFDKISLSEMDGVSLMNRTDTKFVFPALLLPEVLKSVTNCYKVLYVNDAGLNKYHTLYYDTNELKFYTQHHNGKLNRYKVRFRKYADSGTCYLEIKFKNNKGKTIKSRIKKRDIERELSKRSLEFIEGEVPVNGHELQAKLWNQFSRLTLVGKEHKERVTVDLNLGFKKEEKSIGVPGLIIAEVKQEKYNIASHFIQAMRTFRIQPMRISKYCIGSVLLNNAAKTNLFKEQFKYNRFKPKILILNKIEYGLDK